MTQNSRKIKWGIVGLGNISHSFAEDLMLINDAELYAVGSRSVQKAKDFAAKFKVPKPYGTYNELFADPEVDIIYIATPHDSHAKLSMKAMQHGKHVLCEKPSTVNSIELKNVIEVAKERQLFFMEALWTRFNPSMLAIKDRIKKGELGDIKYINAQFSFKADRPLSSRLLDRNLAGGALLDIGIYPIFLAYTILGIPDKVTTSAKLHPITGVDMQTAMIFDYKDAQAMLYASFNSRSETIARISGTEAEIVMLPEWYKTKGYTLIKNDVPETFDLPVLGKGYSHEIMECHKCLQNGKIQSDLWSHKNSTEIMQLLDTIRNQIGLKYPADDID